MTAKKSAQLPTRRRGKAPPETPQGEAVPGPQPVSTRAPFGSPKRLLDGGTKTSLVQRVHNILLEGLDDGSYRPGERVKAAELAKRLGVSRAPVREALHVLAGQGIVELLPDKGAVMRELTIEDLIQIYEVAGALVVLGVGEAARRIDEKDHAARIRAAIRQIEAGAGEPPSFRFYLLLNEFHYVVNEIAQKPYVDFLLGVLNIEYWNRFLPEAIDLHIHIPRYVDNYSRLADAVLAGDWRAAEATMASHSEWSISLLRERQRQP